jgi:tetratricopeptide (TPR) repeat protein
MMSSARDKRAYTQGHFVFSHLLTREAAYGALLDRNRASIHSVAADVLAEGLIAGAPDELSRLIAVQQHLELAERWAEAHAICCQLLSRRASMGRFEYWEQAAQHAGLLWERGRLADSALPAESAPYCNAWAQYLALTGRAAEGSQWGDRAIAAARVLGDNVQLAVALSNCGLCAQYSGDQQEGLRLYREALAVFRKAGDTAGVIRALNNIGNVLNESDEHGAAQEYLKEALSMAQQLGHKLHEANVAMNLGITLAELGKVKAARGHYELAIDAARLTGARSIEGVTLGNLGDAELRAGNVEIAQRLFEQALQSALETGVSRFVACWAGDLAKLHVSAGNRQLAQTYADRARAAAGNSGDPLVLEFTLQMLAEVGLLDQPQNEVGAK